jgi:hypothetical protein
MTDEPTTEGETHRPNEYGFGGGATTPEPVPEKHRDGVDGESIAVPAGDLTGAVTEAIEDLAGSDDDDRR